MRGLISYSLYVLAVCAAARGAAAQDNVVDMEITTSSSIEAQATDSASAPVFSPYVATEAVFFEQFTDDWESRWKASSAKKETGSGDDVFSYVGRWSVEEPIVFPGIQGDKGLVVKDRAAHHAISAKFPEPLDNTGKTLVVQYEVKTQDGLECGGAYLKLLSDSDELHSEEFSDKTPYQVMFGPDRCGSTNKVHFIVRRKNPKTGEYEEKHMIGGPHSASTKTSSLYTLIIKPDQTFEVRVNSEVLKSGSFFDALNFAPGFNPPLEIEDPDDVKPADWVDDAMIPDPEQSTKPEDWDETEPREIPDPDAVKPEDWDEDMEELIPDPDAEKPEDWDDEEDGEWIPALVSNPACEEHGCGKWTAPLIPNPLYKGKWVQPRIPNPDYKGPWSPRKIPNPDYFEDKTPSDLEPIGAIGFELWTMQKDILFDNIYVGHSIEEAEKIGNATFAVKYQVERKLEADAKPKLEESKEADEAPSMWKLFTEDPVTFLAERINAFYLVFQEDPIYAVKMFPETAAAIGVAGVTILSILFGTILFLIGGQSTEPAKTGKPAKATKTEKEGASAEATSASVQETSAKKRATRSSAE
ncbi:Calreticulin family-domain-containing protein [Dipodascopsis uninucleata]